MRGLNEAFISFGCFGGDLTVIAGLTSFFFST